MPTYDEKVKAECVEMVKQGSALTEITKKLGPNPKAIQRYCEKAGVEIKKAPKAEKKETAPKAPAAPKK